MCSFICFLQRTLPCCSLSLSSDATEGIGQVFHASLDDDRKVSEMLGTGSWERAFCQISESEMSAVELLCSVIS